MLDFLPAAFKDLSLRMSFLVMTALFLVRRGFYSTIFTLLKLLLRLALLLAMAGTDPG
jgi:hypothetical protein